MGTDEDRHAPIATVKLYRMEEEGAPDVGRDEIREPTTDEVKAGNSEETDGSEIVEIEIASAPLSLDGSVTVGRRSNCNLQPMNSEDRPDGTVSRIHCIISAKKGDKGAPTVLITCVSVNCIYRDDVQRVPESASKIFEEDSFFSLGGNVQVPNVDSGPRRYRLRCQILQGGEPASLPRFNSETAETAETARDLRRLSGNSVSKRSEVESREISSQSGRIRSHSRNSESDAD